MNPKHIILLICAGHSEQWIARTAVDNGDIPWHFTARRTKFHWGSRWSTDGWSQKGKLGQKSQQRRVMWPLREGREIWGVDGAFASMTWRRHCVRDGVAPSANELAWFYMGSDSVTQWAFPKRSTQRWVHLWKRTHKRVSILALPVPSTQSQCFFFMGFWLNPLNKVRGSHKLKILLRFILWDKTH